MINNYSLSEFFGLQYLDEEHPFIYQEPAKSNFPQSAIFDNQILIIQLLNVKLRNTQTEITYDEEIQNAVNELFHKALDYSLKISENHQQKALDTLTKVADLLETHKQNVLIPNKNKFEKIDLKRGRYNRSNSVLNLKSKVTASKIHVADIFQQNDHEENSSDTNSEKDTKSVSDLKMIFEASGVLIDMKGSHSMGSKDPVSADIFQRNDHEENSSDTNSEKDAKSISDVKKIFEASGVLINVRGRSHSMGSKIPLIQKSEKSLGRESPSAISTEGSSHSSSESPTERQDLFLADIQTSVTSPRNIKSIDECSDDDLEKIFLLLTHQLDKKDHKLYEKASKKFTISQLLQEIACRSFNHPVYESNLPQDFARCLRYVSFNNSPLIQTDSEELEEIFLEQSQAFISLLKCLKCPVDLINSFDHLVAEEKKKIINEGSFESCCEIFLKDSFISNQLMGKFLYTITQKNYVTICKAIKAVLKNYSLKNMQGMDFQYFLKDDIFAIAIQNILSVSNETCEIGQIEVITRMEANPQTLSNWKAQIQLILKPKDHAKPKDIDKMKKLLKEAGFISI